MTKKARFIQGFVLNALKTLWIEAPQHVERHAEEQVDQQDETAIGERVADALRAVLTALGEEAHRERDHREHAWREQCNKASQEPQQEDAPQRRALHVLCGHRTLHHRVLQVHRGQLVFGARAGATALAHVQAKVLAERKRTCFRHAVLQTDAEIHAIRGHAHLVVAGLVFEEARNHLDPAAP
ncbi:MAG: hypothetical protein QM724_06195 [Flavobacteriales bacterium]